MLVKMKICNKKIRGKHETFDIIKGKKLTERKHYELNYTDKKGKDI